MDSELANSKPQTTDLQTLKTVLVIEVRQTNYEQRTLKSKVAPFANRKADGQSIGIPKRSLLLAVPEKSDQNDFIG